MALMASPTFTLNDRSYYMPSKSPLFVRGQSSKGEPLSTRYSISRSTVPLLSTPSLPTTAPFVPAPLPPLNLRPLPAVPYAVDAEFEAQRARDRDAIDFAVKLARDRAHDRVTSIASCLEEIDEEKRRLEEATRALAEHAREIGKTLTREREEAEESNAKDAEVERVAMRLKVQLDVVKADIDEVKAKLAARREFKRKQKDAFEQQSRKNAPELAFFEEKLGLKVTGQGHDVVSFKFSNVDPGSFARSFSFDLDASKVNYSRSLPFSSLSFLKPQTHITPFDPVASMSPPSFLPASIVNPLLEELNTSRDLYSFILSMRQAFQHQVKAESSNPLSSP